MVHTYIQFHQDCKSLQQGIGEMTLFLKYWKIIHEISWDLDLRYLWNLNTKHLHQNKKYMIKIISLKDMNISPSAPHSIELKYGEKTWDERKNKMRLICPWNTVDFTCKLWIHWISMNYLNFLSKHQLGWGSFTLEIG